MEGTTKWKVEGYAGYSDCDSVQDYNLHFEIEMDKSVTKEELEALLLHRYKKHRCIELNIEQVTE